MTYRVELPNLAGDLEATSGTGWLVLASDGVDVPSLAEARACARPGQGAVSPCVTRVLGFDVADGAVVVGLAAGAFTVHVTVAPGWPADATPILTVLGGATARRVSGSVVGSGRTMLRFEHVLEASDADGPYRLFLEGHETDAVGLTLSLGGPPQVVLPAEVCALALTPIVREVVPRATVVGGFPLPPRLAVTTDGRVVEAWSADAHGRALVPRGEREVEVRERGAVIAVLASREPVRDAAFVFGGVALASAHEVLMSGLDGTPWSPPVAAAGLGLVVGLGVTEGGELVIVDASPAPGRSNLRVLRRDGSELAPPATVPGRGWYARRRGRGLVFDAEACAFAVDPGQVASGCCAEARRLLAGDEARYFELVSELPSLRARVGYPARGSAVLGAARDGEPLDAGRPGAHWHRVLVFGVIPDGCSLTIETRTADEVAAGHPLITSGWSRPLVATAGSAVPVAAPDDVRTAAADVWVLAGPGRFLWLRLTLGSDGRSTPRVTGLEIERERPSIGRYLPRFLRDSTPEDGFLARWLALFETTAFDGVAARMRAYPELFDPRTAPETMLPYLAAWLSLPVPPRVAAEPVRLRRILARAAELARARGTVDGLVEIIRLYTDVHVQVRESFVSGSRFVLGCGPHGGPVLGCDTALTAEEAPTYLGDARLGSTQLLEVDERTGTLPAFFEVLAPAAALCSSETRSLIETLIASEKPVHSRHALRVVAPHGWVLGVASTVGQSISPAFERHTRDPATYGIALGGAPTRSPALGQGLSLGRNARLARAGGPPTSTLPVSVGRSTIVAADGGALPGRTT